LQFFYFVTAEEDLMLDVLFVYTILKKYKRWTQEVV